MVKFAKLIVGWWRIFPLVFFFLSSLGMYNPIFAWIFGSLSFVTLVVWFATYKWAERVAPSSTPFMDYFWDLYDRSQKILEEHKRSV